MLLTNKELVDRHRGYLKLSADMPDEVLDYCLQHYKKLDNVCDKIPIDDFYEK